MFSTKVFNFSPKDIVTVVTVTGEFVGRFVSQSEDGVTISSPRAFILGDEGRPALAPGVCASGKQEPDQVTFLFYNVITVVESHKEIAEAWVGQTSGLVGA